MKLVGVDRIVRRRDQIMIESKKEVKVKVGYSTRCQTKILQNRIELLSLIPTENEALGYVKHNKEVILITNRIIISNMV